MKIKALKLVSELFQHVLYVVLGFFQCWQMGVEAKCLLSWGGKGNGAPVDDKNLHLHNKKTTIHPQREMIVLLHIQKVTPILTSDCWLSTHNTITQLDGNATLRRECLFMLLLHCGTLRQKQLISKNLPSGKNSCCMFWQRKKKLNSVVLSPRCSHFWPKPKTRRRLSWCYSSDVSKAEPTPKLHNFLVN